MSLKFCAPLNAGITKGTHKRTPKNDRIKVPRIARMTNPELRNWKYSFNQNVRFRNFIGVSIYGVSIWNHRFENHGSAEWKHRYKTKWILSSEHENLYDSGADYISSDFNRCSSLRAFRRRLREWNKYLPYKIDKPIEIWFQSRFVGYNIIATMKPKTK